MNKTKTIILKLYWRLFRASTARLPMALSACFLIALASVFQLVGLGLVVPVLNGLVDETSFLGIKTAPVLGKLIRILPIEQTNLNIFIFMILLIFSAVVLENICLYFGRLQTAKITEKLITSIRIKIFAKLSHLSREFFDHKNPSEINSLIVHFINSLAYTTNNLSIIVIFSFFAAIYLVLMFTISWQLSLCAIVMLPLAHLTAQAISKKIRLSAGDEMSETINVSSRVDETFRNISLVQLENQQERELSSFSQNVLAAGAHSTKVRQRSYLVPATLDIINAFGALLIVAVSVLLFFSAQSYSLGRLLVFFVALRRFTSTVQQLSSTIVCSTADEPALQALNQILFDPQPTIPDGKLTCPTLQTAITFKDVNFSYKNNTQILHNISFIIPAKQITALVGATGSGKSTISNLIPRFYDIQEGKILFDNTDIKEFNLASLRSHIGLVSQKELLFNTSIKDNITYGVINFTEDQYVSAIEQAQLTTTIAKLPNGDQTIIGSQGVRLSGGEKQRIQIARALLKNPSILILDEATSSLDAETEAEFELALKAILPGRTVIIIAHRLKTVMKAHQILFIESGEIVESGTYEQLINLNQKFAEYCRLQNLE